jgi:hypothetical protein
MTAFVTEVAPRTTDVLDARAARDAELRKLLETAAHFAHKWYESDYLLVDRTAADGALHIRACVAGDRLVDLWELNFMLWDEANWAATRLVAAGAVAIFRPQLHND